MVQTMGRVSGKIAIVTGAASGLGAASARMLAHEGAAVMLTDRQLDRGEAIAADLRQAGCSVSFLRHDVTSEADWIAVVEQTEASFGGLHVLVNNAGVGFPNGSVEEQSLEDWQSVMSVNLDGVFLGVKHAIGAMRRTGTGGSIVNVSSILGITASPTTAAYCASKGGVRLLTKSAALHCAKLGYGIRVNSLHPGYVWTPLLSETLQRRGEIEAGRRAVEALIPLGHTGEPDDIAYGVVYLASDESRYVTGAELVIDGGYLAQ